MYSPTKFDISVEFTVAGTKVVFMAWKPRFYKTAFPYIHR